MADPYDHNDEPRPGADAWGGISSGVQTGTGIAFLVIGLAALIAAAVFQERVALMVGIVSILFGITRLVLPLLRRRR